MAKMIEFDLSGSDEEVWEQGEGALAEDPKAGVYQAQIHQINPGYSKGEDGKPDKSRPRLEVISKIIGDSKGEREPLKKLGHDGGDCYNAWVWDYVSFSEASEWKQAQFFRAIGEGSPKKAKGKFNAEKHEGKTIVRIRVKADTNLEGDYRAKVGGMWAWTDDEDTGVDDDDLDDELDDEDDEELEVPDIDEIRSMKVAALKEVAAEHDIDIKGLKKPEVIDTLIEELHGSEDEDEDDDDDLDDDDDDLMDDDDDMEDEDDELDLTADDVNEMGPKELKELAKEHGVSLKGLNKSQAREKLIEELDLEDVPF